jgi:hypothetical protein
MDFPWAFECSKNSQFYIFFFNLWFSRRWLWRMRLLCLRGIGCGGTHCIDLAIGTSWWPLWTLWWSLGFLTLLWKFLSSCKSGNDGDDRKINTWEVSGRKKPWSDQDTIPINIHVRLKRTTEHISICGIMTEIRSVLLPNAWLNRYF